jgi:dolichol kinase
MTLLPTRIGWKRQVNMGAKIPSWSFGYDLTRYRCENAVLLGAVGWGIWKLGYGWDEWALAGGK